MTQFKLLAGLAGGGSGLISLAALLRTFVEVGDGGSKARRPTNRARRDVPAGRPYGNRGNLTETQRARLGLEPAANEGRFEILAISAGEGNGWLFPPETLRASLALWQGAECFVDHALSGRSLRDLAGVCSQPAWDEALQGIRLVLQPAGPSGALAAALGREMTAATAGEQPLPGVGFSADLLFHAEGRRVTEILKVLSVDVVIHPARGGRFLRSLQSAEFNAFTTEGLTTEAQRARRKPL